MSKSHLRNELLQLDGERLEALVHLLAAPYDLHRPGRGTALAFPPAAAYISTLGALVRERVDRSAWVVEVGFEIEVARAIFAGPPKVLEHIVDLVEPTPAPPRGITKAFIFHYLDVDEESSPQFEMSDVIRLGRRKLAELVEADMAAGRDGIFGRNEGAITDAFSSFFRDRLDEDLIVRDIYYMITLHEVGYLRLPGRSSRPAADPGRPNLLDRLREFGHREKRSQIDPAPTDLDLAPVEHDDAVTGDGVTAPTTPGTSVIDENAPLAMASIADVTPVESPDLAAPTEDEVLEMLRDLLADLAQHGSIIVVDPLFEDRRVPYLVVDEDRDRVRAVERVRGAWQLGPWQATPADVVTTLATLGRRTIPSEVGR